MASKLKWGNMTLSIRRISDEEDEAINRFAEDIWRSLQAAVANAGLTDEQLGDLLDLTQDEIREFHDKSLELSIETIARIAWSLGYKPTFELVPLQAQLT